ncbi:MAG: Zn-ribbon domain-containing OB-fold protein [Gammaproteobacteria bacterium]
MNQIVLPPAPVPNYLTQFFWDGVRDHRLMILRCNGCGHYIHYPRPTCRQCLGTDLSPVQVSGKAELYAWTIPGVAIDRYYAERPGTIYAVVELPEQPGLRMPTNIVDCAEGDLRIGLPLEVTFREIGPGLTLPLFRPRQG